MRKSPDRFHGGAISYSQKMKRVQQILTMIFVAVVFFQWGYAQTANGGCSSVTVTSAGGGYPTNSYFSYVGYKNCQNGSCCRVITSGSAAQPYYQLQQLQSNGTWSNIGSEVQSTTFSGLGTHGTYRVRIKVPRYNTTICSGTQITLYNLLGQFIGYWGEWNPTYRYTNNVVVGSSVVGDITYDFVDGGGGNSIPNGFDFGETVTINTTGTKNYQSWWVAIFENGAPMRYRSMGWTNGNGTLPTTINLSSFWNGGSGWTFNSLNSYTVQFAISAPCNTAWANLDKSFFICPAGSGCRPADIEQKITVSPNPANGSIKLSNYEMLPGASFKMVIIDMSGRTVKSFDQYSADAYDVSDLGCGMYSVAVWDGQNRTHTSKLTIAR